MPTKENKEKIAEAVSKKVGLSKRQALESLNVVLDEISKSLSRGEQVLFTGFGKFFTKKKGAKNLPKFKAGQALKDDVK